MSESDFTAMPAGDASHEPVVPPEAFYIPQEIQPVLHRSACEPNQIVYLKQYCFTQNQVFPPGEYCAFQLPDVAFGMGMVIPPAKPIVRVDKRESIELILGDDSIKGSVNFDAG